MSEHRAVLHHGHCPETGKRSFATRQRARAARCRLGGPGIGIYRCGCGDYHLGHLPRAIVTGDSSRGEVYGA